VSAYPFVAGHHLERDHIDAAGAEVLGEMQGRLHATLCCLPAESLPLNSERSWDTAASIAMLRRVDDLIP
jgi:Ser/Thr protein kinase RdoA (MazF antagonist)